MAHLDHLIMVGAVVVIAGCAGRASPTPPPSPSCAIGDTALVRDVLYFGRNRQGGGAVTDEEWQTFLDRVLTPRFPAGLTVVAGTGQWKGKSGLVEQEQSEIVTVFHSGDEAARGAVMEVVVEYKQRFRQEAVLRERMPTCVRSSSSSSGFRRYHSCLGRRHHAQ